MRVWLTEAPKRFHERHPIGGVSARPLSFDEAVLREKMRRETVTLIFYSD